MLCLPAYLYRVLCIPSRSDFTAFRFSRRSSPLIISHTLVMRAAFWHDISVLRAVAIEFLMHAGWEIRTMATKSQWQRGLSAIKRPLRAPKRLIKSLGRRVHRLTARFEPTPPPILGGNGYEPQELSIFEAFRSSCASSRARRGRRFSGRKDPRRLPPRSPSPQWAGPERTNRGRQGVLQWRHGGMDRAAQVRPIRKWEVRRDGTGHRLGTLAGRRG